MDGNCAHLDHELDFHNASGGHSAVQNVLLCGPIARFVDSGHGVEETVNLGRFYVGKRLEDYLAESFSWYSLRMSYAFLTALSDQRFCNAFAIWSVNA